MIISEHFKLDEFLKSDTADKLGLDNEIDHIDELFNIYYLTINVLEPIRQNFNSPLIITSGYRNKVLNEAVNGVSNSEHKLGMAVDFTVKGISNIEVIDWIRDNLSFTQLIEEFGNWIHVSYNENNLKNEVLKATKKNGKTVYSSY